MVLCKKKVSACRMRQPKAGNRVKTLSVVFGPRGIEFRVARCGHTRFSKSSRALWCNYRATPSGKRKWAKVFPEDQHSAEYLEDFDCVKCCDKCTRVFYCDDWAEQPYCKQCKLL